jgi:hypothetical protein
MMMRHIVAAAKGFVEIMTEICASGYENVDRMESDKVPEESPHSPGNHRARQAEEDERTIGVAQHLKPDLVTFAKHSALE